MSLKGKIPPELKIQAVEDYLNGVASLAGGSSDLPALDLSGVDAMTVTAWIKREDAGENNARLFDIGVKDVYFT